MQYSLKIDYWLVKNDVGADTDITFDVVVPDLSNFKDGSDMMICRIRQEAI